MPQYLFYLGREPELSIAELETVLKKSRLQFSAAREEKNLYRISSSSPLEAPELMERLGGTVKILESIGPADNPAAAIHDYLCRLPAAGKLSFSLSGPNAERLAIETKKNLKSAGRSVRYIEPKNTATILHNNLVATGTDLTMHRNELFVTRAIQPIEAWSERDYGRPGYDPKSGMLPPKLARLMINLSGAENDGALLDPFCGSGTVLIEALSLGFARIVGSDHSPKAIADSERNYKWFAERLGGAKKIDFKLYQSDARELFKRLPAHSVAAVVTEPYLGKPLRGREPRDFVIAQARELADLYTHVFRTFAKILKPDAPVVFVLPEFRYRDEVTSVNCLGAIKKAGFSVCPLSPDSDSLLYARPGQWVARQIWKFQKN